MKDKTIHIPNRMMKQGISLAGSVVGFYVSKEKSNIDTAPAILIGGFVATLIGEILLPDEKSRD
jgi:hypothetical protein